MPFAVPAMSQCLGFSARSRGARIRLKAIGFIELIQLEDKLKEIFGRKVDLATEGALHPLIRQGVFNDLKVIYEK